MLGSFLPSFLLPRLDCPLVCLSQLSFSHVRQTVVHRGSFTLFSPFPHRQFQLDVDETILIMMRVRKSLEAS